jgi:hypothetical protein
MTLPTSTAGAAASRVEDAACADIWQNTTFGAAVALGGLMGITMSSRGPVLRGVMHVVPDTLVLMVKGMCRCTQILRMRRDWQGTFKKVWPERQLRMNHAN